MENYIVSARKYRPSTFNSVIGQKSLTITLKNAILNGKLAHAYLFCGPRGVGKTTCARIFAKTICCFNPSSEGEACNNCESCRSFNENRSLNIHELDAASNNSVDEMRALTEQVRILPQLGKYKVYIIDEVHMLSQQAFNAFLKTLEEPPLHAVFILATTEKHKVLPTILSRCQIYDFLRININDITDYLAYVAGLENVKFEREALNAIAQKADGGMRDALSIFDQVVNFSQGNVTYKTVIENLDILDCEYYFRLTEAMLDKDIPVAVLLLNEILNKGFDGQHILSGIAAFFRDLLVCKDPQTIVLFESGEAIKEKYLSLANLCEQEFLYKAMELTNETDINYRQSKNKRFALELLLIRLCQINLPSEDENRDKKKIIIEPFISTLKPATKPDRQDDRPKEISRIDDTGNDTQPPAAGRKFNSVSINETQPKENHPETEENKEENTPPVINRPLTQEKLMQAWREFTETITDTHFKHAVQSVTPSIIEDHTVEIEALNPKQEEDFKNKLGELKTFLVSFLQNDNISIVLKIRKENKGKLFTDMDKMKHMTNRNPDLIILVKEFNLRLN
jgi:DNA polymerase-3 subunit gamma/tau